MRSRIAPTPSGYLHLGNAFSFVLTWLTVKQSKGSLLLRIDDLDRNRFRKEYLEDIFYTLDWLKLDYDIGPIGPDDFLKNYSQGRRLDLYNKMLIDLKDRGYLFSCSCSRKEILESGFDGQYPETCISKNKNFYEAGHSWRIKTERENSIMEWKEKERLITFDLYKKMRHFIVRRKDEIPSYQVASLADDIYWGIDTIIRGEDLVSSTAAQLYIAHSLDKLAFKNATFIHHKLIKDEKGMKLSKSNASPLSTSLKDSFGASESFYHWMSDSLKMKGKASGPEELLLLFSPNL